MDIDDTQDELLVDYDDGDAPMREDEETGDAEMVDEDPAKLDEDDTPMVDDVVTEQVVEEIDMQPADADDVDTPMREEGEPSFPETTPEESMKTAETDDSPRKEETTAWPPQPTDVPPVPSLLPSALSVPQETRHEEGKIHDGEIPNAEAGASVVAEPSGDAEQDVAGERKPGLVEREDDVASQGVEPAQSVRGSEVGTVTATAPPSAAPSTTEQPTSSVTHLQEPAVGPHAQPKAGEPTWPPAPTEVPAVPSLLPSALAVPQPVSGEGVARAQGEADGRGSVVADRGSVKGDAGSVGKGDEGAAEEAIGGKQAGGVQEPGEDKQLETGKEARESKPPAVPDVIGDQISDADAVPIILVLNATEHRTLFSPLPTGIDYIVSDANGEYKDLTDDVGGPLLKGMEVDVYRAPLSEVFQALRDTLGAEFAVERGKELVLNFRELKLTIGEDNKYAGEISLHDIVQLFRDCNGTPPMVVHVLHDSPRFFQQYKAMRAAVDAQRGQHEAEEEYDEDELGDDANGDADEGETVYVDAQEDELDDEYDFAVDEDVTFDDAPAVEIEEDEFAMEPAELADAVGAPDASNDPAAPSTDDIVEYEEDEIVVLDTPVVAGGDAIDLTDELDAEGDDQFGVEATIRAAEQQSTANDEQQHTANGAEERTTPGKRPREVDEEQQQSESERQVKRKLSVAEGGGSAAPAGEQPVDGEVSGNVV